MSIFGEWAPMPQQQQMRVDGHAGAGHGGTGSYGGGGGTAGGEGGTAPQTGGGRGGRRSGRTGRTARDTTRGARGDSLGRGQPGIMSRMRQAAQRIPGQVSGLRSSLRGIRDDMQETIGSLFGLGVEDEDTALTGVTPTAVDPTGRRGMTDAALRAQTQTAIDAHRDRGLMAARGMRAAGGLLGPFGAIPGLMAQFAANRQHQDLSAQNVRDPFGAARALARDVQRGYEPGEGGAETAMDQREREAQAKKDAGTQPPTTAPTTPSGVDTEQERYWWETFGINLNDPVQYRPPTAAGPPGTAAPYMQRVTRDLRQARQARRTQPRL